MAAYGALPAEVYAQREEGAPVKVLRSLRRGNGAVTTAQPDLPHALYIGASRRFDAAFFFPGLTDADDLYWEVWSNGEWREIVLLKADAGFIQWDPTSEEFDQWVSSDALVVGGEAFANLYWLRVGVRPEDETNVAADPVIDVSELTLRLYSYIVGPQHVQRELQLDEAFTATTVPAFGTIEQFLRGAEDELYRVVGRYFRPEYVNEELLPFRPFGMTLRNRPVLDVVKLELFNGSHWEAHTEGRREEWHYEPELGIIYLSSIFLGVQLPPQLRRGYSERRVYGAFSRGVRVSYLHGLDARQDPRATEVARVVTHQACVDMITANDFAALIPSGLDRIQLSEKAKIWKEEVDEFKSRYAKLVVV